MILRAPFQHQETIGIHRILHRDVVPHVPVISGARCPAGAPGDFDAVWKMRKASIL